MYNISDAEKYCHRYMYIKMVGAQYARLQICLHANMIRWKLSSSITSANLNAGAKVSSSSLGSALSRFIKNGSF